MSYECRICGDWGVNTPDENICHRCWQVGMDGHYTSKEKRNLRKLFLELRNIGLPQTRPQYFYRVQILLPRNKVSVPAESDGYTARQMGAFAAIFSSFIALITFILTFVVK